MYAVLSGEIRPPSDYRSEVSAELDEIVLKALRRSPDERWQSAREMGKALRRFLAKQEELVGPAEIADWMAELFPNGEARKHELMEIARTSDGRSSRTPRVARGTKAAGGACRFRQPRRTRCRQHRRCRRACW